MHKRYKLWLAGALAGILVLTGSVPAYAKGTEREIGQNVETEMSGTEAESNGVFALSDDTVPAAASAEETETETNDPKNETADPREAGSGQEEPAVEEDSEELPAASEIGRAHV